MSKRVYGVQDVQKLATNNPLDGGCISTLSKTEGLPMSTEKSEKRYDMKYPKRSKAIIFNHMEFESEEIGDRKGTDHDVQRLEECLTQLDFEIIKYQNKTVPEVSKILDDLRKEDHTDEACILVYVLSHGSMGEILANDWAYPTHWLWERFTADKCKTLAGKPKLIFIQACQGRKFDHGEEVTDAVPYQKKNKNKIPSPPPTDNAKIPREADILVMYSTPPGYVAHRYSDGTGSPFVKAFCQVLQAEANSMDLLSMTTRINLQVADFESNNGNKQIPYVTSSLTQDFFFNLKGEKKSKDEKEDQEDAKGFFKEGTGAPVDTKRLKLTK